MGKATLADLLEGERVAAVDFTERLRRWLELHPGAHLSVRAALVDGKAAVAVAVGMAYDTPPYGTWAAVVDNDQTTWPLLEALERAARLFEAALAKHEAKPGAPK